jgi:ABC-type transporter Mla MlaB component
LPKSAQTAVTASADNNVIVFPGLPDDAESQILRARMCDLLEQRDNCIRIDFGQVNQLNARALALLLSFVGEARALQPAPMLEALSVGLPVRSVLRVVGLEIAFSFH